MSEEKEYRKPNDKYKMFLNFMHNDLGISREDIKRWTKEAVEAHATTICNEINVEGIAERSIKNHFLNYERVNQIKKEISKEIANRISLSIIK